MVIVSNATFGLVTSTTCLVSSVTSPALTPKFSKETLNLYWSLGMSNPCVELLASEASGTVILDSDEIAI